MVASYASQLPELSVKIPQVLTDGALERPGVLLISDLHCGENTSAESTLGFSAYNYDIMTQYFANLEAQVIDLIVNRLTGYRVRDLFVVINGDLVSGVIHDELLETAEGTVVEAAILTGRLLATLLARLSAAVETITVIGLVGNHGRLKKDKVYKNKWANWDYVAMKYMEESLRQYRKISIHLPLANMATFEANDCVYLVMHGDNMKHNGILHLHKAAASLNVSRIQRGLKPIKQVIIGHFHQAFMTPGASVNGGWPGMSEYTLDRLIPETPPMQIFWLGESYGPGIAKFIRLDECPPCAQPEVYRQAMYAACPHLDEADRDYDDMTICVGKRLGSEQQHPIFQALDSAASDR